jgi:hypothetical protein
LVNSTKITKPVLSEVLKSIDIDLIYRQIVKSLSECLKSNDNNQYLRNINIVLSDILNITEVGGFGQLDYWLGTTGQNLANACCTDGTYIYVGFSVQPAIIIKFDTNFNIISTWTGETGQDYVNYHGLVCDGTYLYLSLNTAAPTVNVLKIQISDLTTVDSWTHPVDGRRSRGLHLFNSYLYIGDNTSTNSKVFKVDPSTMETTATWTSTDSVVGIYAITNDGTSIYAGGQGSVPAVVTKINVSDMSKIATWTGDDVWYYEYKVDCLTWDGSYLYAGLDTYDIGDTEASLVTKIDTSTMTTVSRWIPTQVPYLAYAFDMIYVAPYLYVTIEGGVDKPDSGIWVLNPTDLSIVK